MDGFFHLKAQFERLVRLLLARGRCTDEAEDAVQEAYVRLLTYVANGKQVQEPEAFLTQVAYNVATDARRRHGSRLTDSNSAEMLELSGAGPGPEDIAESDDVVKHTQIMLDRLVGTRARQVFFLHCYEGFTYGEIAKQVGLTARTVENDLVKAVTALAGMDMLQQLRARERVKS